LDPNASPGPSAGTTMQHSTPSARLLALLLLPLLLVSLAWLTLGPSAHAQKGKEEEEDTAPAKPATTTKPRPKVEEEDTGSKPTRRVVTPEDEVKKPAAPSIDDAPDLWTIARKTKNPAIREFLTEVAEPHDVIVNKRVVMSVAPVEKYLGPEDAPRFAGTVEVHPFDEEWKQEKKTWQITSSSSSISGIRYYEQTVVREVDKFLEQKLDQLEGKARYLPRQEMLRLSETVLSFALRFHESQAAQGKRDGEGFDAIVDSLKKRLLEVQLDELSGYVTGNDWDNAFALASRLADAYPKPEDHQRIAAMLSQVIGKAAQAGNYNDEQLVELQKRLRQLQDRFPDAKALVAINTNMKDQAEKLFRQAQEIVERSPSRKEDALGMLRRAEQIYPRLPGLRDYRLKLENLAAVLRVGVRELPVNLSPNLACTDAEKQAVELLFEGLVKLRDEPGVGQYYAPGLAEGHPVVLPLGRQFEISRDAYWSNDKPVTSADVRNTMLLLKNPKWSGYDPTWKHLVEDVRVSSDPKRVSLTLTQGVFDPLALLTFKVLPAEPWPGVALTSNEEAKFAQAPVGSGPFQFAGRTTNDGRPALSFTASASYGSRAGKAGLPHIREVQFVQCKDPVKELAQGKLDLVTDVPDDQLAALQAPGSPAELLPPLPNRRIYFLAANYRRFALQNASLRKAIAHALDREKILNEVFRSGNKEVHKALNGPFPPGSWACDSQFGYRLNFAKPFFTEAKNAGADKALSLLYPADDPRVGLAVQKIHDQLKAELGMDVQLKPLPPRELREQVEGKHDYDLAYYHYDYPSDAFWPGPLFDPEAAEVPHGSNFLGYVNDGDLLQQLGKVREHRDPQEVQKAAKVLHQVFFEKMPFIPLWQLDTHVAMTHALKPTPFDPLLVFTDIDHWRLEKK
jgi:ABC-type transport system substrate-binding protein